MNKPYAERMTKQNNKITIRQLKSSFEKNPVIYWSCKFLNKEEKQDCLKVYSFVITAKKLSTNKSEFRRLKLLTNLKRTPKATDDISKIVIDMRVLIEKYSFEKKWITSFFSSLQLDAKTTTFKTMKDTIAYMQGSAEVIGLMLARILKLPPNASKTIRYKARAIQYSYFIANLDYDSRAKRCYFPSQKLKKHGLPELNKKTAERYPAAYREFMEEQIAICKKWENREINGLKKVSRRHRAALKIVFDICDWTLTKVTDDPFIVFYEKPTPSEDRVRWTALTRFIRT